MRRTVLTILLMLFVLPVIGQEVKIIRSCRPGLENIDLSKHMPRRASAYRSNGELAVNPLIGERRQVVVLAEFADQGFLGDSLHTLGQWDKILNTKNLSDTLLYGSLHDYFSDQSYGKLDLSFDLFYVRVDSLKKYRSTAYSDENSKYLVQDVVRVISNRVNDWGVYDWNNDGMVDQLLIIYAGRGQNDGGSNLTIWPHQWWLSEHPKCRPISVTTGSKTYQVDEYCVVPELSRNNDYGSFGTLCHEYSHCFGLPDLYGDVSCLKYWDLMDYGNYNGDGFRPCGYSAFERAFLGWLTPIELKDEQTVVGLPALSTEPQAYIVRNEGKADEYYLIENRQKVGWDECIPCSGIVVAHIDYDETEFSSGQPNKGNKKHYVIIPANNNSSTSNESLSGWAYPYNGNNSLTNTSTPAAELFNLNKDGTLLMNKPITEMTVVGGMAQFKFQNTFTGVKPVKAGQAKDDGWYRIDDRLYIHQGKVVWVR